MKYLQFDYLDAILWLGALCLLLIGMAAGAGLRMELEPKEFVCSVRTTEKDGWETHEQLTICTKEK